jgi:hypothetical protein
MATKRSNKTHKARSLVRAAKKRAAKAAKRAQVLSRRGAPTAGKELRTAAMDETNPLAHVTYYEDAGRVFGATLDPRELIARIQTFDWRASLIKLAQIASVAANDDDPKAGRAQKMMVDGILSLKASTPEAAPLVLRARRYVESPPGDLIIAHEEALLLLQHIVILHGPELDSDELPGDGEVALWLLGAAQALFAWAEENSRNLTSREELLAEQARVFRYNRGGDALMLAVRAHGIFGQPPSHGWVAQNWAAVQHAAFGCEFSEYFERLVLPVYMLSHRWGVDNNGRVEYPLFQPKQFEPMGAAGLQMQERLRALSQTRPQLQAAIRKQMAKGQVLPHAPTALIHNPFVYLGEDRVLAVSPWAVRTFMKSGLWAKFLGAAKAVHRDNDRGGLEWLRAFGLMFEEWVRHAATAAAASAPPGRIILPSKPGAADEIEDAVVHEGQAAVFFSAKGRMVNERAARRAVSHTVVVDAYDDYLFHKADEDAGAGAIRLLSARIDMLRAGKFEPTLARDTRVYPVILTYDNLGGNVLLHKWIRERCAAEGLLQQDNVAAPTLASIEDFERLMAYAAAGGSVVDVFKERDGKWGESRLDAQLYALPKHPRIPGMEEAFHSLVNALGQYAFGRSLR